MSCLGTRGTASAFHKTWGLSVAVYGEPLSEDWLFQLHREIAFLLSHFVNVLCVARSASFGGGGVLSPEGQTLVFTP